MKLKFACSHLSACAIVALTMAWPMGLRAENWPQWRGPLFNGSTTETNLPVRWSTTENVAWVTPLPGRSGGTPIVWGTNIFVVTPDADKSLWLYGINKTDGQIRWKIKAGAGDRVVGKNNMAACSPVTDGKTVYALFATSDLMACDFDGKVLWQRKLSEEFGAFANMFLYGSSPLLYEGKLYVPILQRNPPTYDFAKDDKADRQSYLVCIDPTTGRTLWKHQRASDALEEAQEAYITPVPHRGPNGVELILVGGDCVTAHNPVNGEELWRYPGINIKKNLGGRIVPSAVSTPGIVFACGPKRERLVGVRDNQKGLLTTNAAAWSTEAFVPDVCTPLYYQGRLYVLDGDRQTMTCYLPATGEKVWQGKIGVREIFNASPTGADGKIYCLSEEGTAVVLSAGDGFNVLGTIPMGEGPCMSSVVVSDGYVLIRTAKNLYAIKILKTQ